MAITTTFVHRVESDPKLQASVARMYFEAMEGSLISSRLAGWREQLRYLLKQFGRDVVIEALIEDVEGLTVRQAMTLADLAERPPSERMRAMG